MCLQGDQLIATSGVIYTKTSDYNGAQVKMGQQVVRMTVMGEVRGGARGSRPTRHTMLWGPWVSVSVRLRSRPPAGSCPQPPLLLCGMAPQSHVLWLSCGCAVQSFKTVSAAIGSHPGHMEVKLEFQRC